MKLKNNGIKKYLKHQELKEGLKILKLSRKLETLRNNIELKSKGLFGKSKNAEASKEMIGEIDYILPQVKEIERNFLRGEISRPAATSKLKNIKRSIKANLASSFLNVKL